MKPQQEKYVLAFSILLIAGMGVYFEKPLYDWFIPKTVQTQPISDSIESAIVTPAIDTYTEEATAIIIGEVQEVTDHPNNTGTPFTRIVKDAHVDVSEVLKGEPNMTTVSVYILGGRLDSDTVEDGVLLQPGEKVLLFLGMDSSGNYVVFAGSAGKCLIDQAGNVSGEPVFTMPLTELEAKIKEALQN